jgi:predicted transcriptional regulator of viral defense system
MKKNHTENLLKLAREKGVLRSCDLDKFGIPRVYLSRLCEKGLLYRASRGVYIRADSDITENHDLAQVARRVPDGVVCLISALQFYNIGTQIPHKLWIAIGEKDRRPRLEYPPVRVVRFSGEARTAGVDIHEIEGVSIKIYSIAKTIADCFKYRNKIGLDVALEALRECRRAKLCSMDDLWTNAKICRVANVMRPYLEAMA